MDSYLSQGVLTQSEMKTSIAFTTMITVILSVPPNLDATALFFTPSPSLSFSLASVFFSFSWTKSHTLYLLHLFISLLISFSLFLGYVFIKSFTSYICISVDRSYRFLFCFLFFLSDRLANFSTILQLQFSQILGKCLLLTSYKYVH